MSPPAVTQWLRFGIFLGANLAVAAAVLMTLAGPAMDLLADQRRQLDAGILRLQQATAAANRSEQIANIDPAVVDRAFQRFLQGESESLLAADLQTRLRERATASGLSFSSIATLPPRDWNGYHLIGTRIELSGPSEAVARFMSSLEGGSSLLFVQRAKLSMQGQAEADAAAVSVSMDIYGATLWPKV